MDGAASGGQSSRQRMGICTGVGRYDARFLQPGSPQKSSRITATQQAPRLGRACCRCRRARPGGGQPQAVDANLEDQVFARRGLGKRLLPGKAISHSLAGKRWSTVGGPINFGWSNFFPCPILSRFRTSCSCESPAARPGAFVQAEKEPHRSTERARRAVGKSAIAIADFPNLCCSGWAAGECDYVSHGTVLLYCPTVTFSV